MKCLALGASYVFLCRPVMWGLHHDGQKGVTNLMEMVNEEVRLAMALTHCFKIREITKKQVIYTIRPKM